MTRWERTKQWLTNELPSWVTQFTVIEWLVFVAIICLILFGAFVMSFRISLKIMIG